jgi:hypothetical protein
VCAQAKDTVCNARRGSRKNDAPKHALFFCLQMLFALYNSDVINYEIFKIDGNIYII